MVDFFLKSCSFSRSEHLVDKKIDRLIKKAFSFYISGQLNHAEKIYREILLINPTHDQSLHLLGVVLHQMNNNLEAIQLIEESIRINCKNQDAYFNLGRAYQAINEDEKALDLYTEASKLLPSFSEAFNSIGITFHRMGKYQAAIDNYQHAIGISNNYSEAFYNQAISYTKLRKFDTAIKCYQKAIEFNTNYAKAYNNMGILLHELEDYPGAIEAFRKAIYIQPDMIEPYCNQSATYFFIKRYDLALELLKEAFNLNPSQDYLLGTLLHIQQHICDWSDFQRNLNLIESNVLHKMRVIKPFQSLSVIESPDLQKTIAEIWFNDQYQVKQSAFTPHQKPRNEKIRIGYFSADFRDHVVARLMLELFESHDREKFVVIGFSFKSEKPNDLIFQTRLEKSFDEFYELQLWSDDHIVEFSRSLGIDIAVDLGGYTAHNRFGIFVSRVAPVQLSYLGYLGTSGSNAIDYIIADKTLVPNDTHFNFSEKILYIPNYQINPSSRICSEIKILKEDLGLPSKGFIFCCFNNSYKITPKIFNVWMKILNQVPGSILYLYADNQFVEMNLKKEAALLGVDDSRLIFTRRVNLSDYFSKYQVVDLFLDTQPYNAGTTSSDAIWMGVPVLTCLGQTFAGRMAASNLNAIPMKELITFSLEQYESLAVRLATDSLYYNQIKDNLVSNIKISELFNPNLFTQRIEETYLKVYGMYRTKLSK